MSNATLSELIEEFGLVGQRLTHIGAAEGAAGNLSVFIREPGALDERFAQQRSYTLPVAAPALAGGWVLVTGSGRRLVDIARNPDGTLCLLHVQPGGEHALLYADPELRPTSEFNTHLALHQDHVARRQVEHHALVHAQPVHLTYLSHDERYAETLSLSRRLLRWQPETIFEFPEGLASIPFFVPSSAELMRATLEAMRTQRGALWRRHGIITRSDRGLAKAADLVEYAEAAARYEYLNLQLGEPTTGLSDEQLRSMCARLGIAQTLF